MAPPIRRAAQSSENALPARSTRASSRLAPAIGAQKSYAVVEASELIEDATELIAAARTAAIRRPVTPAGSSSTMKRAKISSERSNCRPP
jgi:kynureninase